MSTGRFFFFLIFLKSTSLISLSSMKSNAYGVALDLEGNLVYQDAITNGEMRRKEWRWKKRLVYPLLGGVSSEGSWHSSF